MSRAVVLQTSDLGAALVLPALYPQPDYATLETVEQYWGPSSFKMTIGGAARDADTLVIGNLLWLPDEGDLVFFIEHVETVKSGASRANSQLTVAGRSVDGFAGAARIVIPDPGDDYDEQASVTTEAAMKHYVRSHAGVDAVAARQIPNLVVAADQGRPSDSVSVQARYQMLADILVALGLTSGLGWQTTIDPATGTIVWEVIEPTDRSASVFLDFDFGTISAWTDVQSALESSTVAVVGGQGDLAARDIETRWPTGAEPTGLDRREAFVDARDVESGNVGLLDARGDAFLEAAAPVRSADAAIYQHGSFQPGTDFFLGDIVLLHDPDAGVNESARVVKFTKTWTDSAAAPSVEVAVGKPFPGADALDAVPSSGVEDTVITTPGDVDDQIALAVVDLSAGGANMVPNSSIESAVAGSWTVGANWTCPYTSGGFHGANSARCQLAAQNTGDLVSAAFIAVARTDDWWVSFWSYLSAYTSGLARFSVYEYDAAGTLLATTNIDQVAAETIWTRHALHFGPDATTPGRIAWQATTTKIKIAWNATDTLTWQVDAAQVERGKIITAYAPTPQELMDGQVTGIQLADLSVSITKFASGIVPPRVVAALPNLPDTAYPFLSTVLLTGDKKLYRNEGNPGSHPAGSTWSRAVDGADLAAGSVGLTPFASAVRPVAIVGALPGLPDAAYPINSFVSYSVDGKLYRNIANAWVKSVDGADLVAASVAHGALVAHTITAAEIAALTITAAEIAANTITAAKIAAGTITATEIHALAITAAEIAAATITGAKIAANTIEAGNIKADTITAGCIAAGAIGVDELAALAVTAAKIAANTITAAQIHALTITAAEIAATTITAAKIAANTITAGQISAHTITAAEIAALTITAAEIAAGTITTAKLAVGAVPDGRNLIPNSGAEEIGVWSDRNADTCHSGAYSIRVITTGWGCEATPRFAVTASHRYVLAGWRRGYSGNATNFAVSVGVCWQTSAQVGTENETYVDLVSEVYGQNETWKTFRTYYDMPATAVRARLVLVNSAAGATWWDDLEFYEADLDVNHASGNVIIDSTGITIKDAFGATALDRYGFGPAWVRFIANGFYNGDFAAGSTSDIPASEVGTGSTLADYVASLSLNLPAWVVKSSSGVLKIVADAAATGGLALESTCSAGAQVDEFYQDVPVVPFKSYRVTWNWKYTADATHTFALEDGLSWRDSTHAIIGAEGANSLVYDTTQAAFYGQPDDTLYMAPVAAPANASFLRVRFKITHNHTTTVVRFSDVAAVAVDLESGEYRDSPANTTVVNTGTYYAVAGAEVSFTPRYVGQRFLVIIQWNPYADKTGQMRGNLRITNAADATILDLAISSNPNCGAVSERQNIGGSYVWTADAVAVRKAKAYVSHAQSGTVMSHGLVVVQVTPLP